VVEGVLADQDTLDDIPVGIYVIEKDGTLIACNRTAIGAGDGHRRWALRKNIAARISCATRRVT
jgi:hypothetical protein